MLFWVVFSSYASAQNILLKGIVLDKDSVTPMPYAYVVNKSTSSGILSENDGSFSMTIRMGDTISFSYIGYNLASLYTLLYQDSVRNGILKVTVFLKPKATELSTVIIGAPGLGKRSPSGFHS